MREGGMSMQNEGRGKTTGSAEESRVLPVVNQISIAASDGESRDVQSPGSCRRGLN
jgi:hypothetical protein